MKTSEKPDISAGNETIFLEILPELARRYENSNFENSLNIFIKDISFEADNERFFFRKLNEMFAMGRTFNFFKNLVFSQRSALTAEF